MPVFIVFTVVKYIGAVFSDVVSWGVNVFIGCVGCSDAAFSGICSSTQKANVFIGFFVCVVGIDVVFSDVVL